MDRKQWVSLVIAAVAVSSCQPASPPFNDPSGNRQSFGELVYQILHANLETAAECSDERVTELEGHHAPFVTTFDYAVTQDIVDGFPDLVGGTLLPAADRGDLQAMTDTITDSLELLISDDFDPDRRTLAAVASLIEARSVIDGGHLLALASAIVADPRIKERVHALAALALEHDGVDYTINSMLDLLSRALTSLAEAPECGALDIGDVEETLLRTRGFDPSGYGEGAWVVRADLNSNPRVEVNPWTGTLYEPFRDLDMDGVADVDARGRPLGLDGQLVDIPAFGEDGAARDAYGRALTDYGTWLYEYFDAKQTMMSHALRLGHGALTAGIHRNAIGIVEAALGEPEVCPAAPGEAVDPTCRRYAPDDHPVADVVFLLLEALKDPRFGRLPDGLSRLVQDDPVLVEELLVAVGQLFATARDMETTLTTDDVLSLVEELLPLVADIFDESTGTGESTPRLLLDRIDELGQVAFDFPGQLEVMLNYSDLADRECTADTLPVGTVAVDYARPRWDAGLDNRSSLEQAVEMLVESDCGHVSNTLLNGVDIVPGVPIIPGLNDLMGPILDAMGIELTLHEGTISYMIVDAAAQLEPDQVCEFIQVVIPILDWAQDVTGVAAYLFGCEDTAALERDLDSLMDLANSGGLDFIVPLAHVFYERGQLPLLFQIFHILVDDLWTDEDASPDTHSVVRQALPLVLEAIEVGAVDRALDLLHRMAVLPGNDAGDSLSDVAIDAVAAAVETRTVHTRQGDVAGSSIALQLLPPARRMVSRVEASADPRATVAPILDHVEAYFTTTYVDDNDTPDPADDRTRLANRNLMPLIDVSVRLVGEIVDLEPGTYQCYVQSLQDGADEFLVGRDFATLVRLLDQLERSPNGQILEEWILEILDPATTGQRDVVGPLMVVAAEVLTSEDTGGGARDLMRYVGAVLDPERVDGARFVTVLDDLLQHDAEDAILTLLRNLVGPGPDGGDAPIVVFATLFGRLAAAIPEGQCSPDADLVIAVEDLESLLTSVVAFMNDDQHGLGAIYALIGMREGG